jgi:hypothetical protein
LEWVYHFNQLATLKSWNVEDEFLNATILLEGDLHEAFAEAAFTDDDTRMDEEFTRALQGVNRSPARRLQRETTRRTLGDPKDSWGVARRIQQTVAVASTHGAHAIAAPRELAHVRRRAVPTLQARSALRLAEQV